MKKIKYVLAALVACGAAFSLASCSKVTEKYADKVTEAFKEDAKDTKYTYKKVLKDLGKEAIDITIDAPLVGRSGVIVAVKGCKSKEDIEKKINDGKKVEGLVITIAGDIATAAVYKEIKSSDLK